MEKVTRLCTQCDVRRPVEQFSGYKTCDRCRKSRREWFFERRRREPEFAERLRQLTNQSREKERSRRAADPEYAEAKRREIRERNRELRRQSGRSANGDNVSAMCVVCGDGFDYVFTHRHRTRCDLCLKYANEYRYYGLTGAQVVELLKRQTCEICGSPDPGRKDARFRIDHCHETGVVRGILCHPCNIAIGLMQDKPEILRAAARYLEESVVRSSARANEHSSPQRDVGRAR